MQQKNIYRKTHLLCFGVSILISVCVWLYWEFVCTQGLCSWEIRNYLFRPLIWGFVALSIVLASLLVFPAKLFKQWLFHIAIWSIPLAFLLVLDENPHSSSILSFGRGLLSWVLGTFIFILTALYAVGWHLVGLRKGSVVKKEFLKLLVFIPATLAFYIIWQLF